MKVTADTITDEQIRKLRALLGRLLPLMAPYDDAATREAEEDIVTCRLALYDTEALSGQPRSDWWVVHREARTRCAAILNARAGK